MTFVQGVYFILKLLEMAQQNIFHVAAGSRFAPADNRYNTHQLFMRGAADVQRLSVGQFHFLEIGFPLVTRSIFPFAGGWFFRLRLFCHLYDFCLPCFFLHFRRIFLWCCIRLVIPFSGYALRDNFFHEIFVYLRFSAVLFCHIISI